MIALGSIAVVKLAKGALWRRRRQLLLPSASMSTVDKVKQQYQMNEIAATKWHSRNCVPQTTDFALAAKHGGGSQDLPENHL